METGLVFIHNAYFLKIKQCAFLMEFSPLCEYILINHVFFSVYPAACLLCWLFFLMDNTFLMENIVACSPLFKNISLTVQSHVEACLRLG